jgi:hypothetical protein
MRRYVRSADLREVGYVIATDTDFITVRQGQHEVKIRWADVGLYNGSEVVLKISEEQTREGLDR